MQEQDYTDLCTLYSLRELCQRIADSVNDPKVTITLENNQISVTNTLTNSLHFIAEIAMDNYNLSMRITIPDTLRRIGILDTFIHATHYDQSLGRLNYMIGVNGCTATQAITLWRQATIDIIYDFGEMVKQVTGEISPYMHERAIELFLNSERRIVSEVLRKNTNNFFRTEDATMCDAYNIAMKSILQKDPWQPIDVINMVRVDPISYTDCNIFPATSSEKRSIINEMISDYAKSLVG